MRMIPKKIRLLPEIPQYAALERPLKEIVKNGHWKIAFARLRAKWLCWRYMKRSKQFSNMWRTIRLGCYPLYIGMGCMIWLLVF